VADAHHDRVAKRYRNVHDRIGRKSMGNASYSAVLVSIPVPSTGLCHSEQWTSVTNSLFLFRFTVHCMVYVHRDRQSAGED